MKQFVQDNILPHLIRDDAHDLFHFIEVRNLAIEAVKELDLEDWQKEYVVTAAFLHDIDDKKLQRDGKEGKWVDYVLDSFYINNGDKEIIKTIIDLVSCSKWGDRKDENSPDWYYIVRYCDRLTAIGERGLERCLSYTQLVGNPIHTSNTAKVFNLSELSLVATKERFEDYSKGKKSESAIDHIYDKLYHIELPNWFSNTFLSLRYKKEKDYIAQWVLDYWTKESDLL